MLHNYDNIHLQKFLMHVFDDQQCEASDFIFEKKTESIVQVHEIHDFH